MLRNILSLIALTSLTSLGGHAAEVADTTVVFNMPKRVTLVESNNQVRFTVEGNASDTILRRYVYQGQRTSPSTLREEDPMADAPKVVKRMYRYSEKHKNDTRPSRFAGPRVNVGFVNALGAPSGLDLDMAASIETGFEPCSYRWFLDKEAHNYFAVGVAFDWRNYRLTNRTRFVKDDKENVVVTPYPDEATRTHSSRIKTFSIGIPFRYGVIFGNGWNADLTAKLNFTTYASLNSSYEVADNELVPGETVNHRVNDFYKGIHQQKVTVDFTAAFRWRALGAYVRYSPCKVLNTNYAPSLTPISVGLVLGLW